MAWREAYSLRDLRLQLNEAFPKRNKVSDGGIGDARHRANASSDHNPHLRGKDGQDVYSARDFTHDPTTGIDCNWLAQTLVKNKDPRIKYIIWNKQICSAKVAAWTWRPYNGTNTHSKHLHISVDPVLFDKPGRWRLDFPTHVEAQTDSDIARVTEPDESIPLNRPAALVESSMHCPKCGLAFASEQMRFTDSLCPDCGREIDEREALAKRLTEAELSPSGKQSEPTPESEKETPTGETSGRPPMTGVQPTKLKGWYAAVAGSLVTYAGAVSSWYAGLSDIVQASIFIGGGIATGALIVGVIWIKNQREERAAQKDLELIRVNG